MKNPHQVRYRRKKKNVEAIRKGENVDLPLDTTMTVIRSSDTKRVLLHSCVAYDENLAEQVDDLGHVTGIIAPNLQHWVFLKEWAKRFPDAIVYHSPAALGESLPKKLDQYVQSERLQNLQKCDNVDRNLQHCLLEGAPLMLNETLFFHKPSETLIASDAFYGGYQADDPFLTWFSRIWFKITKGSWRSEKLPIYRTSRVKSHGDSEQLVRCVQDIIDQWEFKQIVFAHGTNPFNSDPRKKFIEAWVAGVGCDEA
eukprot:gb/GECG01001167.1/.p1 GENE.gb/GECG01001167.1/~~gb/GECG01001167.1/.p1  ORF type:complete len:255 (+),score=27.86 gb/GECG01001167.1/:1-765(+)